MQLNQKTKTTIILLIVAFLGGASAYIISVIRGAEPAQHEIYGADIPLDAHLLSLDKLALAEAYQKHLVRLFDVWMSDGGKDSSRIRVGLRNARRAYGEAAGEIVKREQELQKVKP